MSKKDIFGDDELGTLEDSKIDRTSFAAMFETSLSAKKLSTGDRILGEVLSIGKTEIFVSTGTPTDGVLPTRDVLDKEGKVPFQIGAQIAVQVLRVREGEILLRMADSLTVSQDVSSLEDAFDMELPVEGVVTEVVKGGFRVKVLGKAAFCPISQLDSVRIEDGQKYLNQKYEFIITQFEKNGRNIVVSRRKLLDLQNAEKEGAFMQTAKPGDLFDGIITKLERFGAFIRLDAGPEGLIPISEIAWGRIGHPQEILTVGQRVNVKLLKIDDENPDRLRIAFSLKQAGGQSDPWIAIHLKYQPGTQHEGTVEKKEPFGLFVTLEPGITGLLPKSKYMDSVDHNQYESKKKGDRLKVRIDQVMFEEKKINLGVPQDMDDPSWKEHQTNSSFGTLGDLLKNVKTKK